MDSIRQEDENFSFASLGLNATLLEACERLQWQRPSQIQREAIPPALQGRDVVGLAETGSGKTGAYVLPILQFLCQQTSPLSTLILTPTRELASQVTEIFKQLTTDLPINIEVIIGGVDMVQQSVQLAKKPHVIIATPGRILEHLNDKTGFKLNKLKYLVLDEADKMLHMDFEQEVDEILRLVSKKRQTFLYSATMTKKVAKLQRACVQEPVKVEVSFKYQTPKSLSQHFLLVPSKHKEIYLLHLINHINSSFPSSSSSSPPSPSSPPSFPSSLPSPPSSSIIIFVNTCIKCVLVSRMLRHLRLQSIFLHGQLSQAKRQECLRKFKEGRKHILVATDLASRGLDLPGVDAVINMELPEHSKDYMHRVGRTARAGRKGASFTIVTQYDIQEFMAIEDLLGGKMEALEVEKGEVMRKEEEVHEALKTAKRELSELQKRKMSGKVKKRKEEEEDDEDGGDDDDDGDEASGVRRKFKKSRKS